MVALRKPTLSDLPSMEALMAPHVASEALLPRTRLELVRHLRDFTVAEEDGHLVGLASVSLVDLHLAEVGAVVCEQPQHMAELLEAVLSEARQMGVDRAFILAPDPSRYAAFGFEPTQLSALPEKRDRQCLRCPRMARCKQVPLVRSLAEG